ncbi:hypothetical protein PInf_017841 [Phytophthora infestans]|nr:hypothetical protein PInf_017841 [Phytophthora infestans]
MPHYAGVDLILGTDFMITAGIRLDLYNSAVKLPDEMVIPLILSSNAPTQTEFGPNGYVHVNSANYQLTCAERWRRIEADTEADEDERRRGNADVVSTSGVTRAKDVRADRTPVLHVGQDFEDDGAISDASTSSAVEVTSAVGTKEEASATEDSAITEGDPEECSERVLRDEQPAIDDRAKFEVIRPSIVGEVNSAMSTLTTISAGINHVVTANSALEDPAVRNDLGAVPACHMTADYAKDECGRVDVCPAVVADSAVQCPSVMTANSKLEILLSRDVEDNSEGLSWTANTSSNSDEGEVRAKCGVDELRSVDVVSSAMGTPKACIIQSVAVDSASADLNVESDSDAATACHQDVSYTGEGFAFKQVSSAVLVSSADQHYDATEYYDTLETMEAETGSNVVRRQNDDTIYLGDKFEHAEIRSATVVD